MFLLTHAGFRLLWELSSENVSVCTLAHARVCDMTSRNYRAPVDQIYPQILGKPVWISHGLGEYCFVFFFLLVQPLPLCVCESPSAGKVWGIIYLEFQVRAPWRGPRAPTEKWGGCWLCDPADFLSSLLHFTHLFSAGFIFPHRHSLISILHFLLTHFYRRPGDVVLTNALLLRNPRLTLNEATEAKKTRARAGPVLLWKKHEPSWDRRLSLLEWSSFALSKGRLHWKHAAICSLTWRLLWTDLAEELRADKSVSPFKLPSKTPSLKCFCGFHYFLFLTSIY